MAITRLERKGRKNKAVAKKRVSRIKLLSQLPPIKNVDVDAIKAEFESKKSKPSKKKAEEPKEEVVATVEATEEKAPKKKVAPKAKKEDKTEK